MPPGAAPPSRSGVPRNGPYAHPGAYPHRYTGLSTVTSNSEDAVESAAQETAAQQAIARARPPRERAPPSAFKPAALTAESNPNLPQENTVNANAESPAVPHRVASPTGIAATAAAVAATAGSRRSSMESVGARDSFARDRNADRDRDVQSSNGHSWTGAGAGAGAYPPPGLNGGYQYPPASPPPGAQPMSPMSPMGSPYAGYAHPGQQQQQYPGGYAPVPVGQAMYPGPGQQGQYGAVPPTPTQGQYSNLPPTSGSQAPTPRPHNAFMSNSAMARSSVSASSSAVDLVPFSARITGAAPPSAYGPGFGGHSRRNSYADGVSLPFPQSPSDSFCVSVFGFLLLVFLAFRLFLKSQHLCILPISSLHFFILYHTLCRLHSSFQIRAISHACVFARPARMKALPVPALLAPRIFLSLDKRIRMQNVRPVCLF